MAIGTPIARGSGDFRSEDCGRDPGVLSVTEAVTIGDNEDIINVACGVADGIAIEEVSKPFMPSASSSKMLANKKVEQFST